ncbi:eCIS core domain-containing protein [Deinococcus ficus]|uniref:eCIS core domain-containing protein n=1 Tax=Deinococcus ficus TaxID=317577 RepID=UPI000488C0D0
MQEALQRTLGTSVRDIRVVRNAQVPALLSAANAEGLAVDRTVFLPAHVDLTTPAGHALAAHEFTHALRRTQPGFMPDVVRRADPAAPSLAHEEELAVLTEHLAHQEAQDAPRAPARTSSLPLTARERRTPRDMSLPRAPIMPAPTRPELAPVTPAAPARTSSPAPQVHAADMNRPAPQPPSNPAPAPSKEREKDVAVGSRQSTTPQVDLDQVARDVYARLRERLGEELRRLRS